MKQSLSNVEHLLIESTQFTPYVDFDPQAGMLFIQGISMPENVLSFYTKILEWLEIYLQTPPAKTELHVRLDYFNTASSKILLEIFSTLEMAHIDNKTQVDLFWYYYEEDFDSKDIGNDYKYIISIPFHLTPYNTKTK